MRKFLDKLKYPGRQRCYYYNFLLKSTGEALDSVLSNFSNYRYAKSLGGEKREQKKRQWGLKNNVADDGEDDGLDCFVS